MFFNVSVAVGLKSHLETSAGEAVVRLAKMVEQASPARESLKLRGPLLHQKKTSTKSLIPTFSLVEA